MIVSVRTHTDREVRRFVKVLLILVAIASIALAVQGWYVRRLETRINTLETRTAAVQTTSVGSSGLSNEQFTAIVARVAPAVVSISAKKQVPRLEMTYTQPFHNFDLGFRIPVYRQRGSEEQIVGAGTGFLISPQGHILTNRHVVDERGAQYIVTLSDGKEQTADVIQLNEDKDIALLKIAGNNHPYIRMGDSSQLQLGQSVFAIGNALGEYSNSVSTGIVSGLNRDVEAMGERGVERLNEVIQTDAAINRGNSGGPLLNLTGEVIGINVAFVSGSQNIGFAIPINDAQTIISDAGVRVSK